MAEKTDATLLWDRELETILYEVGELADRRQFAAYFVLLHHILFDAGLSEKERKQATEAVLVQMNHRTPKEKWTYFWSTPFPEPLVVRLLAGIAKLGLDLGPLLALARGAIFRVRDLAHLDLGDNVVADIVMELAFLPEGDSKAASIFSPESKLKNELDKISMLMVMFSRKGNVAMAGLLLSKFRERIRSGRDEIDRTRHWGRLLVMLFENGCLDIGGRILGECLPAIEAGALWNSLSLLKLSRFLKKSDPIEAKRLLQLAKEGIVEAAGFAVWDKEFIGEFGYSKAIYLREASEALVRNGELKAALEIAREIGKTREDLPWKAQAMSGIASFLIERRRCKLALTIIAEAQADADRCGKTHERDMARQDLPAAFMRMGMESEAMAELEKMDQTQEPIWKCWAMNQVATVLFERNEWEKGENLLREAIDLGMEFPDSQWLNLHEISGNLARLGYEDWAFAMVKTVRLGDPDGIKIVAMEIFARSAPLAAVNFIEKAYDISFFSRSEHTEASIFRTN